MRKVPKMQDWTKLAWISLFIIVLILSGIFLWLGSNNKASDGVSLVVGIGTLLLAYFAYLSIYENRKTIEKLNDAKNAEGLHDCCFMSLFERIENNLLCLEGESPLIITPVNKNIDRVNDVGLIPLHDRFTSREYTLYSRALDNKNITRLAKKAQTFDDSLRSLHLLYEKSQRTCQMISLNSFLNWKMITPRILKN